MKYKNNFFIWIVIILVILVVYNFYTLKNTKNVSKELSYSKFLEQVDSNNISSVVIANNSIVAKDSKGNKYVTIYPYNDTALITELKDHKVDIKVLANKTENSGFGFSFWFFLIGFIVLVWFLFSKGNKSNQNNSGGGGMPGPFSFGKSKARMISPKSSDKVTFSDVAGIKEPKDELQEVVDFLKKPEKFRKLGAKIPKGILLVGAPGTGKTLLARAVAGEADVPFFVISGSDFVEMFVGVGASRVRDMFNDAKKNAPCIIFIDEIDAVGRHRGAGLGGGNDEREQTLNQLLVEMDGFSGNLGVIIMAATNRPDVLDPALLRPGRFDRQVTIPYPDVLGREQILAVHSKKVPLSKEIDLEIIARGTTGFTGADLANLINEAALFAAKKDRSEIVMEDFEDARDKIIMGSERKSMVLDKKEKELTAYHEGGHTLLALKVKNYHPLHKVTIIPRGRALGVTTFLPEKDQYNYNLSQLQDQLIVLFGGRIAEELIYGKDKITTGASGDIQMASNLARKMVSEWGYNDELGRVRYEQSESEVFLGHSVAQRKNISENTAQKIDEAIKDLITNAENDARKIIKENMEDLEKIAKALLKYETLSAKEIETVLSGEDIEKLRVTFKDSDKKEEASLPLV